MTYLSKRLIRIDIERDQGRADGFICRGIHNRDVHRARVRNRNQGRHGNDLTCFELLYVVCVVLELGTTAEESIA